MASDRPGWCDPLTRALEPRAGRPSAGWVQLATVRADGRPANRTMVFRGFTAAGALRFVTDRRHAKIAQLSLRPWGEVCCYNDEAREQFRLLGRLSVLGPDAPDQHERRGVWRVLSAATRAQYAWPQPGAPRADDAAFVAPDPPPGSAEAPPATFALLLLEPVEVDHLRLRTRPHTRRLFRLEGGAWTAVDINP